MLTPVPKPTRWTSEKYLQWVRRQPCAECGHPESEPHHIKGVGHFSGAGLKSPDWATIPLCRRDHEVFHRGICLEAQWELLARTMGRFIEAGILTIE